MTDPNETVAETSATTDTAESAVSTPETPAPEVASSEDVPTKRVSEWVSERTFADFPISPELLQGLTALGYSAATPVQAMTIDPALAGKDLLVRAKTGTGKTCAFCVPVLQSISAAASEGTRKVRAIMLAPTRELAIQVAQECTAIGKFLDVRIAVIYGGVGFGPQEDALRDGVDIVVGTPGRVLDHVRRGNLDLSGARFAVLDEADEMLSMGFLEDVRKILDKTPKERQSLFVSATINESVKNLIRSYLRDPEEIYLSVDGDNVSSITHVLYETSPDYHKARALIDLIEKERPKSAIIFCNTREDVNTVYTFLDRQGLGVEMISGELPQNKREKVMARVKASAVQFLVSTDVAARGIDISGLSHVINYSLPEDAAVYLHRCGRTGRIGNQGTAITLAGGADFSTRLTLERQQKIQFEVRLLPTPEESKKLSADRYARMVKEASGSMAYEAYLDAARQIKERPDGDMLIAVALRAFLQWDRQRKIAAADEADGGPPAAPASEAREGGRREERGARDRDGRDRDGRDRDGRDRGERRDRDGRDRNERRDRDGRERGERREGEKREDRGERREGEKREDRGERREGEKREDRSERRDRGDKRVEARPPRAVDAAPPASTDETSEDTDELEGGEDAGAVEGEGAAKKKRRRRKKKSGSEGTTSAQDSTEAVPAAAEAPSEEDAEGGDEADTDGGDTAEGGDAAKKRRRRRRGGRNRNRTGGESGGEGGSAPGESSEG